MLAMLASLKAKLAALIVASLAATTAYGMLGPSDNAIRNATVDNLRVLTVKHSRLVSDPHPTAKDAIPLLISHGRIPEVRGKGLSDAELFNVSGKMTEQLVKAAKADGVNFYDWFKPIYLTFDTSLHPKAIAPEIASLVEANDDLTVEQFVCIGHSMGGNALRSAIEQHGLATKVPVPGALLLASPGLGTTASLMDWNEAVITKLHPNRLGKKGAEMIAAHMELGNASGASLAPVSKTPAPDEWKARMGNPWLEELSRQTNFDRYFCYAGVIKDYRGGSLGSLQDIAQAGKSLMRGGDDHAFYVPAGYITAHQAKHPPQENDGLVSRESAWMVPHTPESRRRGPYALDHSAMFGRDPKLAADMWQDLKRIAASIRNEPRLMLDFDNPPRLSLYGQGKLPNLDCVFKKEDGSIWGEASGTVQQLISQSMQSVRFPQLSGDGQRLLVSVDSTPPWVAEYDGTTFKQLAPGDLAAYTLERNGIVLRHGDTLLLLDAQTHAGHILVDQGASAMSRPVFVDEKAVYALTDQQVLYQLPLADRFSHLSEAKVTATNVVSMAKVERFLVVLTGGGKSYQLKSLSRLLPLTLSISLDETKTPGLVGKSVSLPLPDLVGVAIDWDRTVAYLYSSDLTQPIFRIQVGMTRDEAVTEIARGGELDLRN